MRSPSGVSNTSPASATLGTSSQSRHRVAMAIRSSTENVGAGICIVSTDQRGSAALDERVLNMPAGRQGGCGVVPIIDEPAAWRSEPVGELAGVAPPDEVRPAIPVEIADIGKLPVRIGVNVEVIPVAGKTAAW